jgi:hypothetical protein
MLKMVAQSLRVSSRSTMRQPSALGSGLATKATTGGRWPHLLQRSRATASPVVKI